MTLPKISIVTPSFNQGEFIEDTIQSVLQQDYPNTEYVVIDGGSTDDSVDIIQKYKNELLYWVSEADEGQSHAINKGLARMSGEIVTWLNSDDVLMAGALHAVADAYHAHPDAVAWVGGADVTDRHGMFLYHQPAVLQGRESLGKWGTDAVFFQPSCFFSRSAYEQVGGLKQHLHYAMDPDLWLRIAEFGDFIKLEQTLSKPRIYPECKSHLGKEKVRAELIASCVEAGLLDAAEFHLDELYDQAFRAGVRQAETKTMTSRVYRGLMALRGLLKSS